MLFQGTPGEYAQFDFGERRSRSGRPASSEGASDKARWYIKRLREGISAVLPLKGRPIREYSVGRGWVTAFTLVDGRG